jgi:hypothetical protein
MSDDQLYATTGSYAADGFTTQWHVRPPVAGCQVTKDAWSYSGAGPVREIFGYIDAATGQQIGASA